MNAADIHRLTVFLTAAEAGSFSAAARELGIGQPAVSRAVAALEDSLGVRLVERSTRSFRLSEAGARLEREARGGLENVRAALARAARADRPHRIVVAVKPHADAGILAPAVEAAAHAGVEADVVMCDVSDIADLVRTGRADLGVVSGDAPLSGLDQDVLLREPRVVVAAAAHPLAGVAAVGREDVAGLPVITWPDAGEALAAYDSGHDSGAQTIAGPAARNLVEALGQVELDRAILFLPASVAERYASPRLVVRPAPWLSHSEVRAAWRPEDRSLTVARFLQALQESADAADSPRLTA